MSSVCPEGQPPPVAVVHCNDLRSEHRSSVIAVRPPSRDQARVLREDLPASLADAAALDSRRNLKPGRQKSLQVPQGHLLGCLRWTVLEDGPSLRTGNRIFGGRSGVFTIPGVEHLLSAALETTSRSTLADGRTVCKFVPFGTGIGLCPPFGWQTHAGLYPGLPCGERTLLRALVWPCGLRHTERSGVDTTHRPGGSHTLSSTRATRSPAHRTFGPWLATASMVSR